MLRAASLPPPPSSRSPRRPLGWLPEAVAVLLYSSLHPLRSVGPIVAAKPLCVAHHAGECNEPPLAPLVQEFSAPANVSLSPALRQHRPGPLEYTNPVPDADKKYRLVAG